MATVVPGHTRRGDLAMRTWANPITGDAMKLPEAFSWSVQRVMRTWKWVAAYTALTFVWWAFPSWFGDPTLNDWNRWASLMALWIESVVGIGIFASSIRDSVIIRRIDRNETTNGLLLERLDSLLEAHEDLVGKLAKDQTDGQ